MNVLVSCNGTIQLVSALAAMRQDKQLDSKRCNKALLISDLCVHEEDLEPFYHSIKDLAESVDNWSSIHFLPTEVIPTDQSSPEEFELFSNKIKTITAWTQVDLLYLSTDSHLGNNALLRSFSACRAVCYGDGPGIYIPKSYQYLTRKRLYSGVLGRLHDFLNGPDKLPGITILRTTVNRMLEKKGNSPFDHGYFLLPTVYGVEPDCPYDQVEKKHFLAVLELMAESISDQETDLLSADSLSILLTSNFSEAQRISVEDEIAAYHEFLSGHEKSGISRLIIKPHPRDSKSKIEYMKSYFDKRVPELCVLDTGSAKYLPLEALLIRAWGATVIPPAQSANIYAVSSAMLSFKYLLNMEVTLGYGRDIVGKYFFPSERELRIKHESDLIAIADRMGNEGLQTKDNAG